MSERSEPSRTKSLAPKYRGFETHLLILLHLPLPEDLQPEVREMRGTGEGQDCFFWPLAMDDVDLATEQQQNCCSFSC